MAYKFQLGDALMSGSLVQQGSFELEDDGAPGLRRFSVHRDTALVSGSGGLSMRGNAAFGTAGSSLLQCSGTIVAGNAFQIGNASITETELEMIDGITAGTAAASKAVVLDASKNIATLGTVGCGAITSTGTSTMANLNVGTNLDVDGVTNLDAVDIDGATQIDATLSVGVDDQGYDVKFFGDTASAYMLWDTSEDDLILGGAGGLIVPEGQFKLGSTAVTSTATELNFLDGFADAGYARAADSIVFFDADDNKLKREGNDDFLTAIAGAGISVVGNQLVSSLDRTVSAWGDAAITLAEGTNYANATITTNRVWTLPASDTAGLTVGDQIVVKAAPIMQAAIVITRAGSQTIDGLTTIELESPGAAVTLIYVAADTWKIV
jgi:hypothetical protein